MVVAYVEQIGRSLLNPLLLAVGLAFRAMAVSAAVVADRDFPAFGARVAVPAELGRPARRDHLERLALLRRHAMGRFVFGSVEPKDILDLGHGYSAFPDSASIGLTTSFVVFARWT